MEGARKTVVWSAVAEDWLADGSVEADMADGLVSYQWQLDVKDFD